MQTQERLEIIKDFVGYCRTNLEIQQLPQIEFTEDKSWATNSRSFGHYIPSNNFLKVYISSAQDSL